MRTIEVRGPGLVATSRCPSLVGDGGSRTVCHGLRCPRRRRAGSRQHAVTARGVGGRAPGVVPQGGRVGGRSLAHPAAPTQSQKIRFRSVGRASHGARALRFLRCRPRLFRQSACRPMQAVGRATWRRATSDAGRRCDYPRPHITRCGRQRTRCFPGSGNPRIRSPAHSAPGGNAAADPRSLRRRSALGIRRCAKASLVRESAVDAGGSDLG